MKWIIFETVIFYFVFPYAMVLWLASTVVMLLELWQRFKKWRQDRQEAKKAAANLAPEKGENQ